MKLCVKKNAMFLIVFGAFGFMLVMQSRSFEVVSDILLRNNQSNVFQEIQILRDKNGDLGDEILDLEQTLEQLTDQESALAAIESEIEEYEKLLGNRSTFGPGVTITIDKAIATPLMVDLVNDLFNAGAEAVSINGIRITNATTGFDTLPQGQVLMNGIILSPPYSIKVIGEPATLVEILELPGAIIDRLEAALNDIKINIERKEVIQMD